MRCKKKTSIVLLIINNFFNCLGRRHWRVHGQKRFPGIRVEIDRKIVPLNRRATRLNFGQKSESVREEFGVDLLVDDRADPPESLALVLGQKLCQKRCQSAIRGGCF